jgi:cyclophilin family peptidyl-prolyl cis-trans isomerase
MSAKKNNSSRRRSRPVQKKSMAKKIKRNKSAMFLSIFIVIILIASSSIAIFQFLGGEDTEDINDNNDTQKGYQNDPEYLKALSSTNNPVAVLETSKGEIAVELYENQAPYTCENFIKLVKNGFYDGLVFHRVIDDFMIQGGGFTQERTNKDSPYGNIATFEGGISHADGVISMASTGAGVPGSNQFFICDGAQTSLDGDYAAFGKTIYGMDVVRDIAKVKTTTKYLSTGQPMNDWPEEDVIINKITMGKE